MKGGSRQRLAPGIATGLALSALVALRCVSGWPGSNQAPPWERPAAAFVLLLAAVSLVVVPSGLWLRRAVLKDPASADWALLCGIALSALPLALFGGVLKSTTHHRPLGGATFAVVACVVLAFCIGLARRVGSAAGIAPWLKQFFCACSGLSLLVTIALGGFGTARVHVLVDFLVLGAACAGAGLLKIPNVLARIPGLVSAGVWGLLVLSGVLLAGDPALARDIRARAPISFAALSWLGVGS
ncbi:MAG TPA: hypothetical protein VJN18_26725 [Polyangiaceae bacterium]|nr:hypothetical protein [Polyangiaceae bacterium]